MVKKYLPVQLLVSVLMVHVPNTFAAESVPKGKPRFEAGVAAAGVQVPAYPSSSVTSKRNFFSPWFIYRSEKLQVKDGGVNLTAYESDKLTVDLGVGVSLNADTSITPLRNGMPDIDYLLELGPRFDVSLLDETNDSIRRRLNWTTALRLAMSTDGKRVDFRGPVLNTQLRYRMGGFFNNKISFNTSVESTWLGNELMDYFFAVEPEYQTPVRPEFNASGGFLGVSLSAGINYRPTTEISTYFGFDISSLDGSKNEDSPLFEQETNTRMILAFSWRLYKSKGLVLGPDD